MRSCAQVSTGRVGSFAQAYQAATDRQRLPAVHSRNIGVVVDLDEQALGFPTESQPWVGVLAGVFEDVGQAFLHDPVRGQVYTRVQVARCALDLDGNRHSSGS
jgi:hypothetical protein